MSPKDREVFDDSKIKSKGRRAGTPTSCNIYVIQNDSLDVGLSE